jgi:hypothetical protein
LNPALRRLSLRILLDSTSLLGQVANEIQRFSSQATSIL